MAAQVSPALVAVQSPVLTVESLSVSVPGERPYDILCPTDLTVGSGDVLGLVGESGSGKTTLALALLGYARPGTRLQGSARIGGQEIIAATEAARRRLRGHLVSYVPQDPSTAMNPAIRIGAQLAEMLAPTRGGKRRADRSRITELLEKVHLPATPQFLRRYPHQLSGGQLQRVSIVMAMVNRPRLIVFDEPTTGLDVTTQSRVLDTIRELIRDEQAAAVYVTHDLSVVSSIATRLAVMYSGVLVEQAPASTLLAAPAHPYSRHLVLATPDAGSGVSWSASPAPRCDRATVAKDAPSPSAAGSPRSLPPADAGVAHGRRRTHGTLPPDGVRAPPGRAAPGAAGSTMSGRRMAHEQRCCPRPASARPTGTPRSCTTWAWRFARVPAWLWSANPAAARPRWPAG